MPLSCLLPRYRYSALKAVVTQPNLSIGKPETRDDGSADLPNKGKVPRVCTCSLHHTHLLAYNLTITNVSQVGNNCWSCMGEILIMM